MSNGRRYKRKHFKLTNFLTFYIILAMFMFINFTLSRYTATTEGGAILGIARFSIKVNEQELGKQNTFDLRIDDKIVPDSEGYFEIEVDPTGTEVSIEYEIILDLTNIANTAFQLTQYSLDNGVTFNEFVEANTITGELNLKDGNQGFSETDKFTIRIYWEWVEDIVNPEFTDTTIQTTVTIKQKVD